MCNCAPIAYAYAYSYSYSCVVECTEYAVFAAGMHIYRCSGYVPLCWCELCTHMLHVLTAQLNSAQWASHSGTLRTQTARADH
jgi:hypothetical protein